MITFSAYSPSKPMFSSGQPQGFHFRDKQELAAQMIANTVQSNSLGGGGHDSFSRGDAPPEITELLAAFDLLDLRNALTYPLQDNTAMDALKSIAQASPNGKVIIETSESFPNPDGSLTTTMQIRFGPEYALTQTVKATGWMALLTSGESNTHCSPEPDDWQKALKDASQQLNR